MGEQGYGSLSDDDLCVINALLYSDKVYERMRESCQGGNSVSLYELLSELESEGGSFDAESPAGVHTTREDWDRLVQGVLSDKNSELAMLQVYDFDADERMGARSVCLRDAEGVPYVVFRGTGTDEDGTEWYDNALGLSTSDTSQQIGARAFTEYIAQQTGFDVVVSGHSKGGNKAMYTAVTSDHVARCVAFDGQGFGSEFVDAYGERIGERSGIIRNYFAEGDFVSPLLNSVAGENICIRPSHLQGDYARNHVVNCLLTDDLRLGERGERSAAAQRISDFTVWLDRNVSPHDRETIGTFLAEALGAGLGDGDLVAALRNNPEGLGCLLGYVTSYPETEGLVHDLLLELMQTTLLTGEVVLPEPGLAPLLRNGSFNTRDTTSWIVSLLGVELLRLAGPGSAIGALNVVGLQSLLASFGFGDSYINKVLRACAATRASIGAHGETGHSGTGVSSGQVHDLTDESLQHVLSAIDAIEVARLYDPSRWNAWDRVNRALGGLGLGGYQDDIVHRYRQVSDEEWQAKEEIKGMYVRAWVRDDEFARSVDRISDEARGLRTQLDALANSL